MAYILVLIVVVAYMSWFLVVDVMSGREERRRDRERQVGDRDATPRDSRSHDRLSA